MTHRIVRLLSVISKRIYGFRFVRNQLLKSRSRETVEVNHGFKLNLTTGDLISNYIYHFKTWEPCITKYVMSAIHDLTNRSFVDIGANIGYFSMLVAKNNPQCQVYSYEPTPLIYEQLEKNVELNGVGNAVTAKIALSDREGTLDLFAGHPMNTGSTGIFKNSKTSEAFTVTSTLLHQEVTKLRFPPRIIKIDTEGSEHKILASMDQLIKELPEDVEFIVEISPELIGVEKANSIINNFKLLNFNSFVINNSYDVEFYLSDEDCSPQELRVPLETQMDILFTRKSARDLYDYIIKKA
jgi:FkbM family methyltransferase